MKRKKTKSVVRSLSPVVEDGFGSSVELPEDVAVLALAAPAAAPSAKIKEQLMSRIAAERKRETVPAGWRFESARTAEGWRQTFPGVRFKTLSVDDVRDVVMLLVEMAPGARFPDHPHDVSADEGIVISGDVDMDGRLMQPGDYYHAAVGTVHTNVTSPSGCTALLSLKASAWRQWRVSMAPR